MYEKQIITLKMLNVCNVLGGTPFKIKGVQLIPTAKTSPGGFRDCFCLFDWSRCVCQAQYELLYLDHGYWIMDFRWRTQSSDSTLILAVQPVNK